MTDLDDRIHGALERVVSSAPLPPSVAEITGRRPGGDRNRRPVLLSLAAVAVLAAAIGGAVLLRQAGDDETGVAQPAPVGPDLVVYLRPDIGYAQRAAVEEHLRGDELVTAVDFFDHEEAYEEFQDLFADDPQLVESVTPEILPTSFRVDVVDHDPVAAETVAESVRILPGVQTVEFGPPQPDIPDQSSDEVSLPWLRVDLPGWPTGEPPREEPGSGTVGVDEDRRVVYAPEGEFLPLLEVLTTSAGYGLGRDNRDVTVGGRPALLSPRYGLWQVLGWEQAGETTVLNAFGLDEAALLAAGEALVHLDDVPDGHGMWILPDPPAGMVERYRTTSTSGTPGRSYAEHPLTGPDGLGASLYATGAGASSFWSYAIDAMSSAVEVDSVMVRGEPGVLTFDGSGYRVDWLEPGGAVTMRIDLYGADRAEVDEILAHLVDVDPEAEAPSTTTSCVVTTDSVPGACGGPVPSPTDVPPPTSIPLDGPTCPSGYVVTDLDGDGEPDTCLREGYQGPG